MTRGRMDNHACRFINDNQILVLEDDIERNIFSDQIGGHSWRDADGNAESALQRLTCFLRKATVDIHTSIFDQALDTGTRKLLQLPDQEFVEPLRSLFV